MYIEQKNSLKGEISVPGDKSISHRAIMFGSLAEGTTEINGFLMGEDCLSTIDCFRKMNVKIDILPENKIKVHGNGLHGLEEPSTPLNTGRSGTTLRLLLGTLVGQPFTTIINRAKSAQKKPVGQVVGPLKQMGANITGNDDGNFCPLTISPSILKGITYNLSELEMYIKSPILVAGLYANNHTTVVEAIKSRNHTELMLDYFGADIDIDNNKITTQMTNNLYAQQVEIPGDFSIASYFITAGLLVPNSDITIKNVGINPTRTGVLNVYKSMGANIEIVNKRMYGKEEVGDIRVTSSNLNSTEIQADMIPSLMDEIPLIVLAASFAKGRTTIRGVKGFKVKESNRIKAVGIELAKMGASIYENSDEVIIEGKDGLKGTFVDGYNDAPVAMTMSIAGLIAQGETTVRRTQMVDVVFPEFFTKLKKL